MQWHSQKYAYFSSNWFFSWCIFIVLRKIHFCSPYRTLQLKLILRTELCYSTVQVQLVGWSRAFWLMTWWQFFQIKLWFSRLEIVVYCDSGYLIRSYIQSWKDRFKLKLELLEGFWIFWLKDTYIFIIVRLGCFLEKFKSSPKNAFCLFNLL